MATLPLGSARRSRRTALVSLCFNRRRAPTPWVAHGLFDFSSASDASPAGTNLRTFARTSCKTSSSLSAPSVKLICSCFSPSSSLLSAALLFVFTWVDGSGVPPAGVVARLEPPPRLNGESRPVALAARFSGAEKETYLSRWSRSHQLAVRG